MVERAKAQTVLARSCVSATASMTIPSSWPRIFAAGLEGAHDAVAAVDVEEEPVALGRDAAGEVVGDAPAHGVEDAVEAGDEEGVARPAIETVRKPTRRAPSSFSV